MPGQGNLLNDQQIADVLTYVRSAWSNNADPVEAAAVKRVRAATKDRKKPWTTDELGFDDDNP